MSKSNGLENSWLLAYFNAIPIANIVDNAAASPVTSLIVSLYSADPGEAGNQATNELAYTPYARVGVVRTSSGWTVAGNQATNAGTISFPKCTGVADDVTATYWGIGRSLTGNGTLDYSGVLGSFLGPGTAKASNDTITIPGLSGVAVGDKIIAIATPTGSIPGNVTEGTIYFAKTVSGNDITISTTSGGSPLDITTDGACFWVKASVLRVTENVLPQLSPSQITITED